MSDKINECPEFPYFGATYPDATCIDGFLWDLDKFEDGKLYGGGEEPCPFCNTEAFIECQLDDFGDITRQDVLNTIEIWRQRYGRKTQTS